MNTTLYYFLSGKFETAVPTKHTLLSLSCIVAIWHPSEVLKMIPLQAHRKQTVSLYAVLHTEYRGI